MADREYVRPPMRHDFANMPDAFFRFCLQVANNINSVSTMLKDMGTYADNAAALAGGLSVGDLYQTAAGDLKIVV